jgi:SAM-dependent methyltransferase
LAKLPDDAKRWWYRQLYQWLPITGYRPYDRDDGAHHTPRAHVAEGEGSGRAAPLPPHSVRGGMLSEEEYLASGERQVDLMIEHLEKAGFQFGPDRRVLDFGCSSGRMMRWLHRLPASGQVFGCDVFSEAVRWCKMHLNPDYRFITSTAYPHLPFEDRSIHLIYAGSVFSHIYELAESWMLELHRILAADGMMWITIRDEHELGLILQPDSDFEATPWFRSGSEARRIAESGDFAALQLGGFRNSNVWYTREAFQEMVRPYLTVHEFVPEAFFRQTAVLLSRSRSG